MVMFIHIPMETISRDTTILNTMTMNMVSTDTIPNLSTLLGWGRFVCTYKPVQGLKMDKNTSLDLRLYQLIETRVSISWGIEVRFEGNQ